MLTELKIGDFLHRKKVPVKILPDEEYSLVTVKLYHKGVILREKKKGSLLGSNMYRVSAGDFILSGIDARNGAFGIVPEELEGAIVTNDFWYFDVDESKVKREFFYWLTTTPLFLDACQKSSKGETQRIRLQKDLFNGFVFHFPPIEEQDNFLQSFGRIDKSLSSLKMESSNQTSYLTKLRQAILQEAIEGKLTESWRRENPVCKGDPDYDAEALLEKIKSEKEKLVKEGKIKKQKPLVSIKAEEVPFELPEGWVWTRLGEIGYTQTGTTPATTDQANFGNYIPFIKPADITNDRIEYKNEGLSEKGLESGRLIKKNSILMVCIGGSIGKCFYSTRDVSCNQQINTISPNSNINVLFLLNTLQSSYFYREVWDRAMISSTPIINKGKWAMIPIPIPSIAEQQAIVDRVEKLLSMVDELEKQVSERKEQSEQLMQSVLREAFEGGK